MTLHGVYTSILLQYMILPTKLVTATEQKYTRIHIAKHADKLEDIPRKLRDKKYVYHFFFNFFHFLSFFPSFFKILRTFCVNMLFAHSA